MHFCFLFFTVGSLTLTILFSLTFLYYLPYFTIQLLSLFSSTNLDSRLSFNASPFSLPFLFSYSLFSVYFPFMSSAPAILLQFIRIFVDKIRRLLSIILPTFSRCPRSLKRVHREFVTQTSTVCLNSENKSSSTLIFNASTDERRSGAVDGRFSSIRPRHISLGRADTGTLGGKKWPE